MVRPGLLLPKPTGAMRPREPASVRIRARLLGLLILVAAPILLHAAGVHEKGPKPLVISNGQRVSLADYLVPGKTTVFDFYSENCPNCRSIAADIIRLHGNHGDIAVVLVNIDRPGAKGIDWQSPVAVQYNLPSTPVPNLFPRPMRSPCRVPETRQDVTPFRFSKRPITNVV
jgi:thiol-disulfide isomerase/thioredoxin